MASKFHIESIRSPGVRELRLHGIFDGTSAWELRRAVSRQQKELPLRIDFSDVDQLFDFGLAILLSGFTGRRWPPTEIVSVRPDWLRLFRTFGLDRLIRSGAAEPSLPAASL